MQQRQPHTLVVIWHHLSGEFTWQRALFAEAHGIYGLERWERFAFKFADFHGFDTNNALFHQFSKVEGDPREWDVQNTFRIKIRVNYVNRELLN